MAVEEQGQEPWIIIVVIVIVIIIVAFRVVWEWGMGPGAFIGSIVP